MAKKVLIIGATGSLGRVVAPYLLECSDDELTLFSRRANSLPLDDPIRERAIAGDVYDAQALDAAVKGQDVVFVALTGNLADMAREIVASMDRQGVRRLIFITSMGILNEIPAWGAAGNVENAPILQDYRNASDVVEASDLNYTVIRPGWYDNGPVDYEVTTEGEPFGGHDVSRRSIADLVMRLIADDNLYSRGNIGINMPNS